MTNIQTGTVLGIGLGLLCVSQAAAQQAPVFAVFGEVFLSDARTPSSFPDTVRVVNQTTGAAVSTTVGALEQGKYGVVLVDYSGNRAAAVGDSITLSLVADGGGLLFNLSHMVSGREVEDFGLHQPLVRFDGSSSVIFGWVRDESGQLIEGMAVGVTDVLLEREVASATSIETGFYAAGGLIVGGYRVEVKPPPGSFFVGEYYNDVPSYDPGNVTQAQTIWLVPLAVFGADFELTEGGLFSGTVTDAQDGTPLHPVRVYPFLFPDGHLLRASRSVPGGTYTSVALPPGTYGAVVNDVGGYLDEYYLEAPSLAEADSLSVVLTTVTPAIDFTLGRDPIGTGGSEVSPAAFALGRPLPNPFSSRVSISYAVPVRAGIRLAVHDVHGRLVRVLVDEEVPTGTHEAAWDGRDGAGRPVGDGVYLVTLEGPASSETRRAVLLR